MIKKKFFCFVFFCLLVCGIVLETKGMKSSSNGSNYNSYDEYIPFLSP